MAEPQETGDPPVRIAPVEIVNLGPSLEPSGLGLVKEKLSRSGFALLLALVFIAWGIEVIDFVFSLVGLPLDTWGIHPRRILGLPGVLISPWLHDGWRHLVGNSISFLGLGFFMVLAERKRFLRTSLWLVVLSGLGTWLIGRSGTNHIGASGLIYGYFGYLILRAWTDKRPLWILAGVIVVVFNWGMFWGVIPSRNEPVSWEAHLCGLLAGLWLGRRHGLMNRKAVPEMPSLS